MILSEAIKCRINELLKEKNLTAYKLSYLAGISNSIISDLRRGKVKEPTLSSITHICEGFEIQLKDFFDSPLFNDVEAIERLRKLS
ncbi:MAG: helix-turn-helix transcriptional regulator [Clostridia bacterium]|nr:helix-turn-helix transcriptional regulator [Clostridia bacterium]